VQSCATLCDRHDHALRTTFAIGIGIASMLGLS
jgi:hypothetical protein